MEKKLGLLICGTIAVLFIVATVTDFSAFTGKVIGSSDLSPSETVEAFFKALNQGNSNNLQKLLYSQVLEQLDIPKMLEQWDKDGKTKYQKVKVISESPPFKTSKYVRELHTLVEVKCEADGQIIYVVVIKENGVWKFLSLKSESIQTSIYEVEYIDPTLDN